MRTVSEKYANSSRNLMDDTDLFSIDTNTMLIGFSLFAIAQLSIVNNGENIRLSETGA